MEVSPVSQKLTWNIFDEELFAVKSCLTSNKSDNDDFAAQSNFDLE